MAREDTRSPRSSPSKCQRTLEPAPTDEGEPSRKKAAATGDGGGGSCSSGSPSLCCGICLSSAGEKSIRGMIDCCDHYFCFICIREWAKVESRCPMCKRRFSSILRPAIEGVFDTERVVDVPLRDQQPPDDSVNGIAGVFVPDEDDYATMWTRFGGRGSTSSSLGEGHTFVVFEGIENSLDHSRRDELRSGGMGYGSDANLADYGVESSQYNDLYRDYHLMSVVDSDYEREARSNESGRNASLSNDAGENDGSDSNDNADYSEESSHDWDDDTRSQTGANSGEDHDGSNGADTPYWGAVSPLYTVEEDKEQYEPWLNGGNSYDNSYDDHVDDRQENSHCSNQEGETSGKPSQVLSRRDELWSNRGGSIDGTREVDHVECGKESSAYSDQDGYAHFTSEPSRVLSAHRKNIFSDEHGKFASGSSSLWSPNSIVSSKGIRSAALNAPGEVLVLAASDWSLPSKENLKHMVETMHDVMKLGFRLSCFRSLTKKCKDTLKLLNEIEDLNEEKADLESCLSHVYDPLGIRTIDPYAESKCTICKGSQDEWLLLLCDLCDSASHTYCVGLGYTVPTGDWLCPDCNILRKSQADGEESDEARSSLLLSIVREGSSSEINGPVTPASPPLNPSCSVSNGEGRALPTRESKVPLFGARTRHQCRDVHSRIQALRENWNALRRGSVSFSSGPAESVIKKNSQKQSERLPKEHDRLGKASSSGSQQLTDKGGEKSAFSSHYKVPYDVSKAWRMMDLAKSRRQGRNSMMTVQHAAKDLIMKGNASERGGSVHQNPSQSSNYCIVGEQKQERRTFKSGDHSVKGGAARFPPERLNLPDLRTIPVRSGNGLGASRDIDHGMIYSGTSGEGSSRAPSLKSEIQSLVRQNLKMLMRGKQLGVNAFKEIARASTHHVLAACGLEHSKSIQYSSFPSPVCPHLDQAKLQHEAGPMPNACRECFDAFVKNVVGLIMQEKVDRVR
ncbi:hypothetical protein CDL15_Pgr008784 [Punica granatum]|uniref:PHD and RING finger domain-containing protein 1 n=1 Tax=Punica granatum TaxID=22663 RepID=A0A218VXQ2_PUNGR|nr:hypothetical protein CDL15_Pgr008784 [Punica granatum]